MKRRIFTLLYQNSTILKRLALLFLFLFANKTASAQQLYLEIKGNSAKETSVIDSINYVKTFPNTKTVIDQVNLLSEKLAKNGYINNQIIANTQTNDSTFIYHYSLGPKTSTLHIYIGKNASIQKTLFPTQDSDTLSIPINSVENFLNTKLSELESKGFSLATLRLSNFQIKNEKLSADLVIITGSPRQLNDIVINGYDKFPKGHLKNIKRLYRDKTFNQQTLNKLQSDFNKFRFVNQTKNPEILFSQDTTKVYLYLEKAKPNKFDGFIGFANDEETQKLLFTGYLDLMLVNFINTGEEVSIYWKSDGKEQKTFNAAVQLPYIFQSPFGVKAMLNIFKQDSTFQNTKTALDIGYFFNYNTRLYLGYQSTESSDIQNLNSFSLQDFQNSFVTSTFEFTDYNTSDFLFPEKTTINLKTGFGKRQSKQNTNNQMFAEFNAHHNLYLNQKNMFSIRSQNFYLQSDDYVINELHRFGGINSIRGFQENSLQGNMFTSILTEYRYIPTTNLYVHTIIDYGYFRDDSSKTTGGLLGLGFGFGLLTNNGLLNLVYANGSTNEQSIKLSNSIVHISFKTTF